MIDGILIVVVALLSIASICMWINFQSEIEYLKVQVRILIGAQGDFTNYLPPPQKEHTKQIEILGHVVYKRKDVGDIK